MDFEKESERIINKKQADMKISNMLEECYSVDPRGLEKDALTNILGDLAQDRITPEDALKEAQKIYDLWLMDK